MKITVRLFGKFRQFGDRLQLDLAEGSRIADMENIFMQTIEQRDASFYKSNNLRASRFCDETTILPDDHPVNDGQCFSILPPVSGG